jgi:site-specific DNA-methyltransferase (adenine-specific)
MENRIHFSSATDNWSTPQYLFDALNKEFHFTLDPCADSSNHKCEKYYTKEQDGLAQDWSGEIVFCNPPYGREIGKWVKKSYDEVYNGTCECVVMLIPARTDTRWFHDWIYHKAEIRFIKGRLKFNDGKSAAPFPSMVVIYRASQGVQM